MVAFKEAVPSRTKNKNKRLTEFCRRVTLFLQNSPYRNLVEKVFSTEDVTSFYYRVVFAIAKLAREKFVERIYDSIFQESFEKSTAAAGEILNGSAGGRWELCYLGGWVVAKLRHKKKQFVRRNLYKQNMREAVDKYDKQARLMESLTENESHWVIQSISRISEVD